MWPRGGGGALSLSEVGGMEWTLWAIVCGLFRPGFPLSILESCKEQLTVKGQQLEQFTGDDYGSQKSTTPQLVGGCCLPYHYYKGQ